MTLKNAVLLATIFALAVSGAGAQTLALTSTAPLKAGTQGTLSLSITGSGTTVAGLQWSISPPTGTALAITAGAASVLAAKSISCNSPTGSNSLICLATGINTNVYADGVVATFSFTPTTTGTLTFTLSGLIAASPAGASVPVTAGPPLVLTVLPSACDLNGDGLVNMTDLTALVGQSIGLVPCTTADLDGDGKCTILDAQRLVNAAITGVCKTGMSQ
jgi:Dockerin type I domain